VPQPVIAIYLFAFSLNSKLVDMHEPCISHASDIYHMVLAQLVEILANSSICPMQFGRYTGIVFVYSLHLFVYCHEVEDPVCIGVIPEY
jgi:hypothetical protein